MAEEKIEGAAAPPPADSTAPASTSTPTGDEEKPTEDKAADPKAKHEREATPKDLMVSAKPSGSVWGAALTRPSVSSHMPRNGMLPRTLLASSHHAEPAWCENPKLHAPFTSSLTPLQTL